MGLVFETLAKFLACSTKYKNHTLHYMHLITAHTFVNTFRDDIEHTHSTNRFRVRFHIQRIKWIRRLYGFDYQVI